MKREKKRRSPAEENLEAGIQLVKDHPLFGSLSLDYCLVSREVLGRAGAARVNAWNRICLNRQLLLSPSQWAYVIAHCQLHHCFGHFDARSMPGYFTGGTEREKVWKPVVQKELWNTACDIYIAKFLADIRFGHQLTGLTRMDGRLSALTVQTESGPCPLPCDALILAPGHSARDTFQMLYQLGLPMERKPFAIGVRIEHSQEAVSRAQFGPFWDKLPAADYKLACHLPSGRSAFTFCVCPGGQVVAAASNYGQVVTNGMSLRARDGANINGGFLVGVNPDDFGGDDPLAGVRFQEKWERAAFTAGGGDFRAPAQLVGDFLSDRPSTGPRSILPTYRPGVTWTTLKGTLPDFVLDTLKEALPIFDRKLHGFAHPDGVLTGVETRSSSPVRILRDETFQSPALPGLYPCGEGAGYAGGITSAAVDGIKAAEVLLQG